MAVAELGSEEKDALAALVAKRKAVFEVHPAFNYATGRRRQIGFDLALYGVHDPTGEPPTPSRDYALSVWKDLQRLAEAVFPSGDRPSRYLVEPFDHALHSSKARRFRDDVELVVEIRHKDRYLDPLDACESQCLAEMIRDLKSLGVQERSWSDSKARWFGESARHFAG